MEFRIFFTRYYFSFSQNVTDKTIKKALKNNDLDFQAANEEIRAQIKAEKERNKEQQQY